MLGTESSDGDICRKPCENPLWESTLLAFHSCATACCLHSIVLFLKPMIDPLKGPYRNRKRTAIPTLSVTLRLGGEDEMLIGGTP